MGRYKNISGFCYIYGLSDPVDGIIKYIGKADDLTDRLNRHLRESKPSKKNNWIKSLRKKGLCPIQEILDVVPYDEWKFWEQYYIWLFRSWGFELKNMTFGGDGGDTFNNHTEEEKRLIVNRMSKAKIGKKLNLSEEGRKRLSESARERNKTPEIMAKMIANQKHNSGELHHASKPVLQYGKNGKLIMEHDNESIAERVTGIPSSNISRVCCGERETAGGFVWKYKRHENKKFISTKWQPVIQYGLDGNFIEYFYSIRDAVLKTDSMQTGITACINGRQKVHNGFIWIKPSEGKKYDLKIEVKLNNKRRNKENGFDNSKRKVLQYDKKGNPINSWESISVAARFYGCTPSNISNVCYGRKKTSKGYAWKFEDDVQDKSAKLDALFIVHKSSKPVIQSDLKGNQIKRWDSIREAGKKLKIYPIQICNVCKGKQKTAGGFLWSYDTVYTK